MLYLDIIFIIIFSLYLFWLFGLIRALKSDAPFVPITRLVLESLVALVEPKPGDLWVDLGSGDGRVLIAACKRYDVRGLGIERISSLRMYSRLQIFRAGLQKKIKIKSGNFFNVDLSRADVVSFYLLPETSERLMIKLRRELKPGARIIFHRYGIPGLRLKHEDPVHKVYVAEAPL